MKSEYNGDETLKFSNNGDQWWIRMLDVECLMYCTFGCEEIINFSGGPIFR
jgi:hypothetical protein